MISLTEKITIVTKQNRTLNFSHTPQQLKNHETSTNIVSSYQFIGIILGLFQTKSKIDSIYYLICLVVTVLKV